ncbi:NUDIX hydrolase [Saccharibacillus sp. CPCC 101409]|uniref:NUDIX domain-containing protein n=1 Tax=Saccharibacillus sp. CPCC 101409 TaxID=3058041 RepID=UPI002673FC8E|nr:NUDIX hydrolase [Saccharibacillus sp. CPCC 101409]MDO3409569.1 NUDIX hydrolase [Saccharibacillus sp. CPCC 101409]
MEAGKEKLWEKTLGSQPIFDGKIIKVQLDTVELSDGSQAKREIVRHPGAVAVLALRGDKLLVVEQFRQPLGRTEIEIPAGKLEPGEDPREAAARELEEETGYQAPELIHLSSFYTSPGFADEIIHFYAAENLTEGTLNPDDDEFLELTEITLDEAFEHIRAGRISDAKTLMAVYAWQIRQLTGKWPL